MVRHGVSPAALDRVVLAAGALALQPPPPSIFHRNMNIVLQVLIANERMSTNHVYCFKKRQPSKFLWTSEIRSFVDNSGRPPSSMYLQMYAKASIYIRAGV